MKNYTEEESSGFGDRRSNYPKAAPEDKSVYVPAEETPLADVMIADHVSRSLCVGLILFALGAWGFRIRRRKNGRHNLK